MAGFAKEVDWLTEEIFCATGEDYRPDYFVAEDNNAQIGEIINRARIITETEFFLMSLNYKCNCFVAVGSPKIRAAIVAKIKASTTIATFPNLIHPDVTYDRRQGKVIMGEGNIICSKNVLTTDIRIGNHVHLNLDCTVGHDTVIGNYCTISPGSHISGNVIFGNQVFIGTGAVVLERVNICSSATIGAGAVVVKDIQCPGTYLGMPARLLEK